MKKKPTIASRTKPKLTFSILKSILGTLLFVIPYKIFVEGNYSGLQLFCITIVAMFVGTLVGTWIARILTNYYEISANFKYILRNLLVILIYSSLIVIGLITWIFETYPLFDLLGMDVLKALFMLKLLVGLASDNLAMTIATGVR